ASEPRLNDRLQEPRADLRLRVSPRTLEVPRCRGLPQESEPIEGGCHRSERAFGPRTLHHLNYLARLPPPAIDPGVLDVTGWRIAHLCVPKLHKACILHIATQVTRSSSSNSIPQQRLQCLEMRVEGILAPLGKR